MNLFGCDFHSFAEIFLKSFLTSNSLVRLHREHLAISNFNCSSGCVLSPVVKLEGELLFQCHCNLQ